MLSPSFTIGFNPKSGKATSNFMPKNPLERRIDKEVIKRAKARNIHPYLEQGIKGIILEVLKEYIEAGYNAQSFSGYLRDYLKIIKEYPELKAKPDVLKMPAR